MQRIFKGGDKQHTDVTPDKKAEEFDISVAFLCYHIVQLKTSKTGLVFLAYPVFKNFPELVELKLTAVSGTECSKYIKPKLVQIV